MLESITLSILSGILVSFEIVIYEYVTKNNPDLNTDALVWIYRLGSVLFLTFFLIYMMRKESYRISLKDALKSDTYLGWYILLSFLSASSIILFFRSINAAGDDSAGIPVTIRSVYIPLAFVLSVTFVKKGKWSKYSWPTYAGMVGVVGSVGLIVYGSTKNGV